MVRQILFLFGTQQHNRRRCSLNNINFLTPKAVALQWNANTKLQFMGIGSIDAM
jgi:hypothetical protein